MIETTRAALDQNMIHGFWVIAGYLLLTNVGLVVGGVISHVRWLRKMRKDIDAAWKQIRVIKNENNNNEGEEK